MTDLLCYGALCADNLIRLPHFPRPNSGVRALSDQMLPGGNALNEARCLAAWGTSLVLMGDDLGYDPEGELLFQAISATPQIDASYLRRSAKVRTPLCRIMITPDGMRTVLAVRSNDHSAPSIPADLLANVQLVSVTRFGAGTLAAAQAAREAGKTLVIGDALLLDEPFAALADVIVGSVDYLRDDQSIEAQLRALHALRGAAVIVTDGPRPVHVLINDDYQQFQPHAIEPVDTSGAGDCFRAGITYGLSQSWDWQRTIEWALASAALWCSKGANTPPSPSEFEHYLS